MNANGKVLMVAIAGAFLALSAVSDAASRHGGGAGGHGGSGYSGPGASQGGRGGGPGYSGGSAYRGGGHHPGGGHYQGSHYRGGHSHYGHSHGGYWGWGVSLGVPWGWGWYDPLWYGWGWGYGGPYAGYPAYGYAAPYGYGCWPYGDCYREQVARSEPTPPTTEVPPPAPGESGLPTQRPLHLNYCDSAQAWFPKVRSCPGGWRLVLPDYSPGR